MKEQPLIPITQSQLLDTPSLWFVLTNKCNLRCRYCYEDTGDASLTEETAVRFLDCVIAERKSIELSSEILEIIFFGGEPTINKPTLIAILEFIRRNQIVCVPRLVTNGLISDDILYRLIDEDVYFQISYDGPASSQRVTVSGEDSSPMVFETIKKIVSRDAHLLVRFTFHSGNLGNMLSAIDFAENHGIRNLAFNAIAIEGQALKNHLQPPGSDEFVDHFMKAYEKAQKKGIRISNVALSFPERIKYTNRHHCLILLPDGQLTTSIKYTSSSSEQAKNTIIGNYDVKQGIQLDFDKMRQINTTFQANRLRTCAGCEIYSKCMGFERFTANAFNEDITLSEQLRCERMRLLIRAMQNKRLP
jgi:sulfatase maturation enzyme AslB (radical SAM superfamily)